MGGAVHYDRGSIATGKSVKPAYQEALRGFFVMPRRQRSEQYRTVAQFLAQRRRQLMVSPQRAQGLLGSAALLPRK